MYPTEISDPRPMCPLFECTYQWNALPPVPGARWEIGGELFLMEQAPIPGAQSCVPFPYKYPISPCHAQCVTEIYGCLDVTIPTKYPPLVEDSDGKSPSFSNISSRYSRWGIPLISVGQVPPSLVRGYRVAILSSMAILSTKTTANFHIQTPLKHFALVL